MRNHEEDIKKLQEILAPIDEHCPLPYALKGEIVMQKLEDTPKRRTAPVLRYASAFLAGAATIAAVVVIANRTPVAPPLVMEQAQPAAEVSMGNYDELQQAFLRMQKAKQQEEKERQALINKLRNGGWLQKSVADFDIMEEATMPMMTEAELQNFDGDSVRYSATTVRGAGDYGETNIQVRGVDEADILKNDGEYFYYVPQGRGSGSYLYILRALPVGKMEVVHRMAIPGYRNGTELYVRGERMALVYSEYPPGGDACASVQIYDISDRESPALVKSFSQKGSMLSSRMLNGRIYLISTQWANLDFRLKGGAIPEEDILPRVFENSEERLLPADCIAILPDSDEPSYLVISSVDLHGDGNRTESAAILGAGSQV